MQIAGKATNTIRFLAVDAIEKARSGHPGLPMGGAGMAYTLWARFLKHCPSDPGWPDRDRFVLSAGHGSMLLYALLHLFEYGLPLDEIRAFRQWGSMAPGHPEYRQTTGVETTTGPLGQGFANAVGMAWAERRLAAEFNRPGYKIVDHYTYVYSGDGCLMEGITAEAASLAGHLKLGKLICLYDDNRITIDGDTGLTFTEDVGQRFKAYGWQVLKVADGNNVEEISAALATARAEEEKPSLVMVSTIIGYGSPNKQGTASVHGAPLGADEVRLAKEKAGWPLVPDFYVSPEVREHFRELAEGLSRGKEKWDRLMAEYRGRYPDLAERWKVWHEGVIPGELVVDELARDFGRPASTRILSGEIMQQLAAYMPNLVGGSADLNASTKTYLKEGGNFQAGSPAGNNIYFGIREHAMAAMLSGITLHGGFRCFGSTFLVFFDYMKPAIRLAALMGLPVIYVFTHDSIAVGEDGPTHQPVEQLANLRSIPNLHVLRPADGGETAAAWVHALKRMEGPTAIILSRQDLPQLHGTGAGALKGGYILKREQGEQPQIILIATGSETNLALDAGRKLEYSGIPTRVVSMPCWELFQDQDETYRESILPGKTRRRLAIEAALPMGWERFTGSEGRIIGLSGFGASAPGELLLEKYGFTVDNIVKQAKEMVKGLR